MTEVREGSYEYIIKQLVWDVSTELHCLVHRCVLYLSSPCQLYKEKQRAKDTHTRTHTHIHITFIEKGETDIDPTKKMRKKTGLQCI